MKTVCLLAVAALCGAVEYEHWKALASRRAPATRLETYFEGSTKTLDKCLGVVEKFSSPEQYAVHYDEPLAMCQIFKRDDLGKYSNRQMDWNNQTTSLEASEARFMYVKQSEDGSDDSITEGGIVATVILSIVFGIMLVACAFLCKEEESDIAGQMDRLEKRELEKEEAASEDWERRSHAEEEKEKAAAEHEIKQVELADKKGTQ